MEEKIARSGRLKGEKHKKTKKGEWETSRNSTNRRYIFKGVISTKGYRHKGRDQSEKRAAGRGLTGKS